MTNQNFNYKTPQYVSEADGLLIGNRIPRDYFVAQGVGESNITVHAGSYHLALKAAGIERFNIMTYSSILPGISRQVEKPERMTHGAVMESIMAVCNSEGGERATAGIVYGWLYNKFTDEKYGGLVCENNGSYTEKEIKELLRASLNELYINGFEEEYELRDISFCIESFVPQKKYGTAVVSLCFLNYVYPIFEK